VRRTNRAALVALTSLSLLGCQRSKEDPNVAQDESAAPPEAAKTAPGGGSSAGSVQTAKSPAKPGDDAMADVVIKTVPVAGGIYMLQGRGGNIGVSAGADGVVLVDDQFAALAPKILAAVRALGKGDPKFVINTHWHGDHTGGNTEFGSKATIVAQENVRKRLSVPQDRGDGEKTEPTPPAGLPVVTFQQSVSLHLNGEEIRVMHLPRGHTDTDAVVFFTGTNVVHMGDHFFNGRFPFVDTASGGDPVQFAANIKAVLDQIKDDTKVIPGHGQLGTKADLAAFHAMLVDTIKVVRAGKKAGKSLADVQKAGLPEKYKGWGEGFIKPEMWIETIYTSVK
jgi:glyoxylase-like metal-dependent hydrolase (beta-lactamase superfamily II)